MSVTLSDLILRIQQRGGWERESGRHTEGTITREIGLSARELQDQLLRAGQTHLYVEDVIVTTASGTSVYVVTDGYYQVISVELDTGSGRKMPLMSFMEGERAQLRDVSIPRSGWPMFYSLVGEGSIELLPTPAGVYTVTIRRIPLQPPLVAEDDTLEAFGFEEWIVCDVVRKLAASEKDQLTVQLMDAACLRLEARVATMARMRDRASDKRIVNVRGRRSRTRRVY